jgi:predicted anti-sigma-YlaC factor YlaD
MSMPTESAPSRTTPIAIGTSAARPVGALGTAVDLLLGTALAVVVTIAVVVLAAALVAAIAEAMSPLPSLGRRLGRSLQT